MTTETSRLVEELRLAARTIRSDTIAERETVRRRLVEALRREDDGSFAGWVDALEAADIYDVDRLQELFYGLDALVSERLSPR